MKKKERLKIASNVYQRLSHQAEKEGKTISELVLRHWRLV